MTSRSRSRGVGPWVAFACLGSAEKLRRGAEGAHELFTGLFATLLTGEEKDGIACSVYSRAACAKPSRSVWPWETEWFTRRLPRPPARVLVGGAGAGAEVRWLLEHQYAVDALEPVPAAARQCAELLGGRGVVAVARYEELSACVLEGVEGPVAALAGQRFDAVILGWGSLSHVLAGAERVRLLRTGQRLAPGGPILASFLMGDPRASGGRARRMGGALGSRLARLLGRESSGEPDSEVFLGWAGFVHLFSSEEVHQLALDAGMRLVWEAAPGPSYPCVTFLQE